MVDNPRFGVGHTLRVLAFLAFVLFACICLALIGWGEFYDWGEGPLGKILLSPYYSIRPGYDGIGLDGIWMGPGRGGLAFSLFLLSDLLFISLDVGLTIFKYFINLLDLLRDNNSVRVSPILYGNGVGWLVLYGVRQAVGFDWGGGVEALSEACFLFWVGFCVQKLAVFS